MSAICSFSGPNASPSTLFTAALATVALNLLGLQTTEAAPWVTNGPMSTTRVGHTATLLPNGKVLVAAGYATSVPTNTAELYDPATGTWAATGDLTTPRRYHTATLLLNGKVLVAGGDNTGTAELYDPATGLWTTTGTMVVPNLDGHTATLLPSGKVLVAGGFNGPPTAQLYDPATGTWTQTGSMAATRAYHTATLLANGLVLVAGGGSINFFGQETVTQAAELYNPATGTWTPTGAMTTPRANHTATLLPNGKVLVSGAQNFFFGTLATAELYDPVTGLWTTTGSMAAAHGIHTASLLPNGQVLVTGGQTPAGATNLVELYNPASGTFTVASPLIKARVYHTATLMPNGKVLVAGGSGTDGTVELYDSAVSTWTLTNSLVIGRSAHTATLLSNGKVLVAGGTDDNGPTNSATLYTPANGTWAATGPLNAARFGHTATLLPNGRVLVAGGTDSSGATASSELYNPATGTWTASGPLNSARSGHTATLLPNGTVLVAGGDNFTATAELYDPATGVWTLTGGTAGAHPNGPRATLLPNGKVLISGGYGAGPITELYDPATRTWSVTGSLNSAHGFHTATLLPNGLVLVAGGVSIDNISGQPLVTPAAELYDPATGLWTTTGSMSTGREFHSATLLRNGTVLVTGGNPNYLSAGAIATAEVYDPATGAWTTTSSMTPARGHHTATLLPTGKVLAVGGQNSGVTTPAAELYDVGLGFSASSQPLISTVTASLSSGASLTVTGSRFRGVSEGSSGNSQDSPADYPVVQLRSVESGQTWFLRPTVWSTTSFTSAPVLGLPAGWTLATVFVNGIPSSSSLLLKTRATASITLGSLSQSYDGTPRNATATTTPSGLNVSFTYDGAADAPVNPGSYIVIGRVDDMNYQGSATNTLVISKGIATVTLDNLAQTYDGTPRIVSATTAPAALTVDVTYNGSAAAPINAGSYTVIGTVNDPNYKGSATNTLVVAKAAADVTLDNLAQTYDGTPRVVSATTAPPALAVDVTYDGSATVPINAGSYTVIGTVNDLNFQGSATNILVVGKAAANVTLGNLAQTYDGTPRAVSVVTAPLGLAVDVTYNGSTTIPINAASYSVIATINDPNYQGGAVNTLVVTKAAASVTLENLAQTYDGTARNISATTAPAGLTVDVTYDDSPNAPTNTGSYAVIGTVNDVNYQGSATNTLVIAKAAAIVTLENLAQTYDGTARNVSATTAPTELTVDVTYDDSRSAPTNTGSYAVIGTVNDPNYQGSATNTLVVGKATATVTLDNLAQTYDGTPKTVSVTTAPPGLTVDVTYDGSATAPIDVGSYTVIGTVNEPNYQGSATNTLVISSGVTSTISLGPPTLSSGALTFSFIYTAGATCIALTTTDVSLPLIDWTVLGPVPEVSPGQFQFTDPQPADGPQRFYVVRSP